MEEGKGRKRARTAGLVLVAGLIGYLVGPPIVSAATNLVVIKDSDSARKARVLTGGAVKVRPNGGFTDVSGSVVFNIAFGTERFAEGTGNELTCDDFGFLSGVVVDGPTSGSAEVVLTGDDADADTTANDIIWEGSVDVGDHLSDQFFDGGVFWDTSLSATVTGTATDARWILYGFCNGAPSLRPTKARQALTRMLSP